jgi:ankyrin repeat protein
MCFSVSSPLALTTRWLLTECIQQDHEGYTPRMRAAERGHVKIVRSLLQSGAKVDGERSGGPTPLMLAAMKGRLPVVKVLRNVELVFKDSVAYDSAKIDSLSTWISR